MDKMEEWEIQELYQLIQFSDVNDWERTRWLLYAIVQVNSKKKIKMEEILKLPWDEGYKSIKLDKEISNEQIAKLKEKSQYILKNLDLNN